MKVFNKKYLKTEYILERNDNSVTIEEFKLKGVLDLELVLLYREVLEECGDITPDQTMLYLKDIGWQCVAIPFEEFDTLFRMWLIDNE